MLVNRTIPTYSKPVVTTNTLLIAMLYLQQLKIILQEFPYDDVFCEILILRSCPLSLAMDCVHSAVGSIALETDFGSIGIHCFWVQPAATGSNHG